ncbi:homocysteine S-methyltransferase family protein [Synechococcus elongatus]|uniref:homocysteine S-methyltransferase family protein n=1 Tax=Synechococcus elongatus TaxID=32046 RepID=UPI0030CBF002
MAIYRQSLPQLQGDLFLGDGGLETILIFHKGFDLPCFASFPLVNDPRGRVILEEYYANYLAIAEQFNTGMILDSPTWRASQDWGDRLGHSASVLKDLNQQSIQLLEAIRSQWSHLQKPIVISGCLGPRGDGYQAEARMDAQTAAAYHRPQIETFAESNADFVSAYTLNYIDEALGVVLAAQNTGIPITISFTVETNGRLPSGETLEEAVCIIDAATDSYTSYFSINCAHPSHFHSVLTREASWVQRIRSIRANASRLSHAELDEATELDIGNPLELGQDYQALLATFRQINVLGGCCGTDPRHLQAIAAACASL